MSKLNCLLMEIKGGSGMSEAKNKIKLFEGQKVRAVWDEEAEKWWFSVVDVVSILTIQEDELKARKYWNKLKQRLKEEGNETVTNCHQLKMLAKDGKMRLTDAADTEGVGLRNLAGIQDKAPGLDFQVKFMEIEIRARVFKGRNDGRLDVVGQ